MSDGSSLPPGLRARILADVKTTPSSTSLTFPLRAVAVTLVVATWLGALFRLIGRRGDWAEIPTVYSLGTVVVVSVLAVAATVGASMRGSSMLGLPAVVLRALLVATPLVGAVWVLAVMTAGPSSATVGALQLAPVCDMASLTLAVPVLAAFAWLRRGLTSPAPELVGACAGAGAAAWAHVVVHAHCPFASPEHVVVGHLLPVVPMMLLGAFAWRRWVR